MTKEPAMANAPNAAPAQSTTPTNLSDASVATLLSGLSDQVTTLVRAEVRLAQAEVTQKAKRLGLGLGLFGGAGVIALLGVNALITAAIFALSLVMQGWL